ncbi:MAG: phosphatase PAP2 family protein [Bacteroidales bacterium]|jgi:undecaprenyl-diphosphatase|nr:phosphatase PAP2 family protein [Bacteroidales bacterium]
MLEHLDQRLFLFLNSQNSPFWDKVMVTLSGIAIWIPLYIAIIVWLVVIYKKRFWLILLFIAVAVLLADQGSVQLFKNVFHRLRPCHEPELEGLVRIVGGKCGGLYGFVSSHAANSFNVALLSLMLIRKRWYTFGILAWAAAIGYSRIYLGVHYPGDVICGALYGTLTGWGVYRLYNLADRALHKA